MRCGLENSAAGTPCSACLMQMGLESWQWKTGQVADSGFQQTQARRDEGRTESARVGRAFSATRDPRVDR